MASLQCEVVGLILYLGNIPTACAMSVLVVLAIYRSDPLSSQYRWPGVTDPTESTSLDSSLLPATKSLNIGVSTTILTHTLSDVLQRYSKSIDTTHVYRSNTSDNN
eukprot:jgi/Botrbrau1/13233/Bobra.0199s0006.1